MMTILPFWRPWDSLKLPPTLCTITLVAIDDLELHARDSVVHDVAQGSRIGEPHPPREMRSVGPVHGVVVEWENAQRFSDGSPVHALYVITTQLIQILTGSEERQRAVSRLSSARGLVGR